MVRKNRRRKACKHIKNLHLRAEIIRNGTLRKFHLEARISFLETTVMMLLDALERRKRSAKSK